MRLVRAVAAGAVGVFVTGFAPVASAARTAPAISSGYAHHMEEAGAENIVNAIVVDFRALDTLGEISALLVAGIGAVSLIRVGGRGGARTPVDGPGGPSPNPRPRPRPAPPRRTRGPSGTGRHLPPRTRPAPAGRRRGTLIPRRRNGRRTGQGCRPLRARCPMSSGSSGTRWPRPWLFVSPVRPASSRSSADGPCDRSPVCRAEHRTTCARAARCHSPLGRCHRAHRQSRRPHLSHGAADHGPCRSVLVTALGPAPDRLPGACQPVWE
ncbi:hydrogen gas-evolving membrane-bound hydrogenase subunit E [Streptomyces sp. NPDC057236]|uniref:hydrogen gas-evolving membrane-bound hydrogenase subunit E n=1 Tax=Streptomyces sp. NPDC057236 TaxID=3346059 RepID=UPI003631E49A